MQVTNSSTIWQAKCHLQVTKKQKYHSASDEQESNVDMFQIKQRSNDGKAKSNNCY